MNNFLKNLFSLPTNLLDMVQKMALLVILLMVVLSVIRVIDGPDHTLGYLVEQKDGSWKYAAMLPKDF